MRTHLKSCYQLNPEKAADCLAKEIHNFRSNRALFFMYEKSLKKNEQLSSYQIKMLEVKL